MSEFLDRLDQAIEENKKLIERAECLSRLNKNEDFKEVFIKHILNEVPAVLNKNITSPDTGEVALQNKKHWEEQLKAVGHLYHILADIELTGQQAIERNIQHEEEKVYYLHEQEESV